MKSKKKKKGHHLFLERFPASISNFPPFLINFHPFSIFYLPLFSRYVIKNFPVRSLWGGTLPPLPPRLLRHWLPIIIITPSGNRDNHCASTRTICSQPSVRPIHTLIVTFPTTDRSQIRSGQRSKLRLSFLPRDTNTVAVAGLELTILMV